MKSKSAIRLVSVLAALAVPAAFAAKPPPEGEPAKPAAEKPADDKKAPEARERPKIEVCFVLDTTGSMSGLIQAAKDKIWSIANELITTKPAPEIKFGLIGYRDIGDEYVTKVTDLSGDIDDIYAKLMKFKAGGGGDGPESVNQALNEGVTKMSWSDDEKVLKIIFLVGDAPPHMDYKQDVKYADSCKMAAKRDLIINTIQCGGDPNTTKIWNEIAGLAEGKFVAIEQDGGAVAMATPFDEEIAKLNADLAGTVVAYGDHGLRRLTEAKARLASESKPESAAARLDFLKKAKDAEVADAFAAGGADAPASPSVVAGASSVVGGGGDLVENLADGSLNFEEIEEEKLPEDLKKLKPAEREAFVKERLEKRRMAQTELNTALKKRAEFIAAEKAKLREEGKGDSFDLKVEDLIREQAAEKGIEYEK